MVEAIRAFIAIELSKEIKTKLGILQESLKKSNALVKWVNPDCIHLTLKFLGNISPSLILPIKEVLDDIAKETASFQIAISKIGTFPKIDYPRVIWVGIEEGENKILEINCKLEERLEKIGLPRESRPYRPHLTLGRVKSSKNKGKLKKSIEELNKDLTTTVKMTVFNIKLFKSTLTPKGAIYTCLILATFAP